MFLILGNIRERRLVVVIVLTVPDTGQEVVVGIGLTLVDDGTHTVVGAFIGLHAIEDIEVNRVSLDYHLRVISRLEIDMGVINGVTLHMEVLAVVMLYHAVLITVYQYTVLIVEVGHIALVHTFQKLCT